MSSQMLLIHHGIKGQKWGVRRFQNEDGSLTDAGQKHYGYGTTYNEDSIIEKGSKISRISFTNSENENGRTYAAYTESDIQHYINNGKMLADMCGGTAYQYLFSAKENLKIPSREKQVDTYLELLDSNPKYKTFLEKNIAAKSRVEQEKLFDKFQYNLVKRNDKSNAYFKAISEQGYNALFDFADMRQKNSDFPILVIDRGKSLALEGIEELS